jgi:predicted transcriptional regulator
MTYDIRSDRVVLFGGSNGGTDLDDTWTYDYGANAWVNATPSFRPPPRAWSAMAYDSVTDCVVLFGGYHSGYYLNDTWIYQLDNIPYVTGISPSNGVLDISVRSDVLLSFSESMNETATERAITTIPTVALNASWSDSSRLLTLAPKTPFSPGTNLTIRVSTNATSADGKPLEHEFVLSFTVYAPAQPTFDVVRTGVIILSSGIVVTIAVAVFSTEWIVYALALLLVPLHMKMSRDKMLSNFTRGRIYQLILNCPGAHLSFIKTVLNTSTGVLVHHLRMLEKAGMIRSIRKGYLKRFYCATRGEITGMNNYGPLRDDIITVLNTKPGQTVSSLSRILSEGRQTVMFCVNSLLDKHAIIEKHTTRGARYYPTPA